MKKILLVLLALAPLGVYAQDEKPDIAAGVIAGQIVADIGCGNGRISLQLAAAAGPAGRVYCRDPNRRAIDTLLADASASNVENLDVLVSELWDVFLPAESIDLALLADVYQYVLRQDETKDAFLDSLYLAMKPGGVVVVVYARTTDLKNAEQRDRVFRQTLDDFMFHGFMPGRRWVFSTEPFPAQIFEFQKP